MSAPIVLQSRGVTAFSWPAVVFQGSPQVGSERAFTGIKSPKDVRFRSVCRKSRSTIGHMQSLRYVFKQPPPLPQSQSGFPTRRTLFDGAPLKSLSLKTAPGRSLWKHKYHAIPIRCWSSPMSLAGPRNGADQRSSDRVWPWSAGRFRDARTKHGQQNCSVAPLTRDDSGRCNPAA